LRQALALAALFVLAALSGGLDNALAQTAFVATWALAGLGLVLIVGQSGQISLGHGATLAVGAYLQAGLLTAGWPGAAALPLAAAGGALCGMLASLPGRRLGGMAFAMSTLALALIVEELLLRLVPLTGGAAGRLVPPLSLFGWTLAGAPAQAGASLALLAVALLACRRLLRSRLGRAWRASRDDEAAAAAIGIDAGRVRLAAFACGGALGGLAGALHAHWLGYLSPEQFGLQLSFELLMLVFVGGVRSLTGAPWGAVVMVAVPQLIAALRAALPALELGAAGLELVAFGLVLVAIVLWRPAGMRRDAG